MPRYLLLSLRIRPKPLSLVACTKIYVIFFREARHQKSLMKTGCRLLCVHGRHQPGHPKVGSRRHTKCRQIQGLIRRIKNHVQRQTYKKAFANQLAPQAFAEKDLGVADSPPRGGTVADRINRRCPETLACGVVADRIPIPAVNIRVEVIV